MKPNDPQGLTEEDIVRLARTMNRELPQGFENELMARVDEIEKKKSAKPPVSPDRSPEPDPDIEEEPEP